VANETEARAAVAELADRKADAVVLWARGMNPATSSAVVDEAHKHNLKVFADAPNLAEAKDLAKAGVDGLISSVTDREVDDDLVNMMKEKNISYAPSLSSLEARFIYADKPSWLGDQAFLEVYGPGYGAYLTNSATVGRIRRAAEAGGFRQHFATAEKNLKKLADAGVTIAFGTGSGLPDALPGFFEHRELELMVAAGIPPMDAIKASSATSAQVLGLKDMGALVVGKKANFMVVSGNPLENMKDSRSIDKVFLNGKELDRQTLMQGIKTVPPQVSKQDIQREAEIRAIEERDKREKLEKHYGPWVLGDMVRLVSAGTSIATPRRSKYSVDSSEPPYRITVRHQGSAGDFRAFYADALAEGRWSAAGNCWEKAHSLQPGKKLRLCADAGANQAVLNITVQ
jgi:hypothetical protein